MPTFNLKESDFITIQDGSKSVKIIKNDAFNNFNESILGLGEIDAKSSSTSALSVIFDLEGFTNFCKQIDPQLAVPEYLDEFLKWIFDEVKDVLTRKKYEEGYKTWSALPFLSKYLGDGMMFLWNTESLSDVQIRNVVVGMYDICKHYKTKFLPKISKRIITPPSKLRCGIARGNIYSVGNGNDFVGPCINMSARLQKLYNLSFCFSIRGIDLDEIADTYKKYFIVKKVNIRGIGDGELVCILTQEFEELPDIDKEKFLDA
jgi:hypothetical protein